MKAQGFLKGAIILTICGFIGKFIGALYRVPLTNIIGSEGLGMYQMVFPLYSLLLTISSSAFPNAISKLLSEADAKGDYVKSKLIFKTSIKILTLASLVCFIVTIIFAEYIAKLQGNLQLKMCYWAIAPAIMFVAFIACTRGYFQSKQNMIPSAVSGLIEQVIKLVFGLVFARLFIVRGVLYGAIGALLGVSISEFVAMIYLLIRYRIEPKKQITCQQKPLYKEVLKITIPITIGGVVLPLSQFIDSALVVNILLSIGYSISSATKMFGLQTGVVGSIINMPVVFSLAIASSVLPLISKQNVNSQIKIKDTITKSILITIVLGVICNILILLLAKPIIFVLYKRSLGPGDLVLAVELLKVASFSVGYLSLVQTTTGILQGMGKVGVPVYSLTIGVIFKLILNIILISNPAINIFGAEISTVLCYGLVATINILYIFNYQREHKSVQLIAN